jgi:hypothetical protein
MKTHALYLLLAFAISWHVAAAKAISNDSRGSLPNLRNDIDPASPSFNGIAELDSSPASLILLAPDPGVAEVDNDFVVTAATPGSNVEVWYGLRPGTSSTFCGHWVHMPISHARIVGVATADAGGVAVVTRYVPMKAHGRTVGLIALDEDACDLSPLVVYTFP